MSETTPLLNQYEAIVQITGKMLIEARAKHWNAVMALGQEYHDAVERLQALGSLNIEDRPTRYALLTQILDNDAQIRRLATPEIDRLGLLIGSMKRQQSVLETYCSPTLHS